MTTVAEALSGFHDWHEPRDGIGDNPFRLACTLDPPASSEELRSAWPGQKLPDELVELWQTCRQARLFEDIDYGQWGLWILSPAASAERTARERDERPDDITPDDFVVGEFLGDQELLTFAPSEDGTRRVLVALPIDSREDWYPAAHSLADFLDQYLAHVGGKYWESPNDLTPIRE